MEMPKDWETILITYEEEGSTVTKKGFYSKLFNAWHIPREWRNFKGMDLPHGFYGNIKLNTNQVISWKYLQD